MNHDDLTWLTDQQPQRLSTDPATRERALLALLEHTHAAPKRQGVTLPGRRRSPQLGPDRARSSRLGFGLAAAAGAAAIGAAVVLAAGTGAGTGPAGTGTVRALATGPHVAAHHAHAVTSPLIRLASDVGASGPGSGDATLIARTTATGGATATVYDLYTDSGAYFFSADESGLAAQVSADNNQGDGQFAREIAAAKLAATGDLATAGEDMATAPDPDHTIPQTTQPETLTGPDATKPGSRPGERVGTLYDNWLWEDSEDALIAGSGQPEVRAGVLRLIATLPDVTVTSASTDGQPTLVLSAGADEVGEGYGEQITIDAQTGVPIAFRGGAPGGPASTAVTFTVSRVSLANLPAAAGGNA